MEHYIFQNTGSGEFGNAQGGGTDLESWTNGYTEGTSDGWTGGYTVGIDVRTTTSIPRILAYPDVFVESDIFGNASPVTKSFSAINPTFPDAGNALYRPLYLRAGETLTGLVTSVVNDGAATLNVTGWVVPSTDSGLPVPWGEEGDPVSLFHSALAQGTAAVETFTADRPVVGTIPFETPLTVTEGTMVNLCIGAADDHKIIRSRILNNNCGGSTITYGTSLYPQYPPTLYGYNVNGLLSSVDEEPLMHITDAISGTSNFESPNSSGILIKPIFSGTVSHLFGKIDVDYIGNIYIAEASDTNNILGTASLPISYLNSSSLGNVTVRLDQDVRVDKNKHYIIVGTSNNLTGNPVTDAIFENSWAKDNSAFKNTTKILCNPVDGVVNIVGTHINSSLFLGMMYNYIEV